MSEKESNNMGTLNELDWVHVRTDFHGNKVETFGEKFTRKIKENPMVPLGTLATVVALSTGLWHFYKGNSKMSQYMMRTRVAAQGFTILSITVGFLLMAKKVE